MVACQALHACPSAQRLLRTRRYLPGQWELLYTTSDSILGKSKPALLRPAGPIYQIIDVTTLTARNKEGPPLFNEVSAELIPESSSKIKVQFKQFKILGLIPVTAPASAAGELDVTYLDEELRISRGNKGNLFVLRMNNRAIKP
ncbi:plastid fibrillin 3 [Micractinium conductrix]|uniref:Plastid fibrillin 3 n=1 Tax=Micractinium conductrix TaxID=554055 RepID=A0A2P6VDA4_9CHLO|nr:plastid fibrillin 3 [Micractinium conductrix]|eukprot:PSC72062.1 plastid fibrillin 3 [Micractinium conductrix]